MTDDRYPVYPRAEFLTGAADSAPLDADGEWRCAPEGGRHVWPFKGVPPHRFQRCACGERRYGERR